MRWSTIEQPVLLKEQQTKMMTERILCHPDGERILANFHDLEEAA